MVYPPEASFGCIDWNIPKRKDSPVTKGWIFVHPPIRSRIIPKLHIRVATISCPFAPFESGRSKVLTPYTSHGNTGLVLCTVGFFLKEKNLKRAWCCSDTLSNNLFTNKLQHDPLRWKAFHFWKGVELFCFFPEKWMWSYERSCCCFLMRVYLFNITVPIQTMNINLTSLDLGFHPPFDAALLEKSIIFSIWNWPPFVGIKACKASKLHLRHKTRHPKK